MPNEDVDQQLMAPAQYPPVPFRYRWVSRAVMPERRGQRCRMEYLTTETGWGYVRVVFEDGTQVLADRQHIRLRARGDIWRKCRHPRCRCPVGRDGSHGMCGKHAARDRRSRREG